MRSLFICMAMVLLSGCSVVGKSSVETAPYKIIKSDAQQKIEVRHYDSLVLVSAPMKGGMDDDRGGAFNKLFGYISGKNVAQSEIAMTAPVFMDGENQAEGVEIPMTAPVFMDESTEQAMMSFVLPETFTIESAPIPTDPAVKLSELKDYSVAAIIFNGTLRQGNIDKHKAILEKWIEEQGYKVTGPYKAAGYNAPFTLPALRRNEVLIPVTLP